MSADQHGVGPRRALPEKKYFKIGEVADLVGVEPHVLRYWETQFPQLRPHKARSGHRLYRRREVETLLAIRELLHVQRFTIAGARLALRQAGGVSSILPRFFEGPAELPPDGDAAGDSLNDADEAAAAMAADEPGQGELTDPDGAPLGDGADGLEAIEVVGLEPEALRAAMSREHAERIARRGVAVVDVVEQDGAQRATSDRPLAARGALTLGPARRVLLEGALADARSILALLDLEDQRDQRDQRAVL